MELNFSESRICVYWVYFFCEHSSSCKNQHQFFIDQKWQLILFYFLQWRGLCTLMLCFGWGKSSYFDFISCFLICFILNRIIDLSFGKLYLINFSGFRLARYNRALLELFFFCNCPFFLTDLIILIFFLPLFREIFPLINLLIYV